MPQMIVLKDFKFAHRGIDVEEFVKGDEPVEMTDECAELARQEGWAEPAKSSGDGGKPANQGAALAAAENKDAAQPPRRRASNKTE